jgi:hypothetical protein
MTVILTDLGADSRLTQTLPRSSDGSSDRRGSGVGSSAGIIRSRSVTIPNGAGMLWFRHTDTATVHLSHVVESWPKVRISSVELTDGHDGCPRTQT